jgi:hypothetical protein
MGRLLTHAEFAEREDDYRRLVSRRVESLNAVELRRAERGLWTARGMNRLIADAVFPGWEFDVAPRALWYFGSPPLWAVDTVAVRGPTLRAWCRRELAGEAYVRMVDRGGRHRVFCRFRANASLVGMFWG